MRATDGRWSRLGWPIGFVLAAIVLFAVYYLQSSRTAAVNSDGASNALQAWAMLHGNVLLRGWTVSDVSFYTTELPQYALVEALRGLNSDVVHICGAMTYTLLVLLAAWLAKGKATGRRAVAAVAIAATPMLAPQLGTPTQMLLLSPDHVGTAVPLLVAWLLVDWGSKAGEPDRERPAWTSWAVPIAVGLILAWTAVGDQLAEVTGTVPLALACGLRVLWARYGRHQPLSSVWYELSLAAAAIASIPVAWLAVKLIGALGGWTITAPRTGLAAPGLLGRNAALTGTGILQLFGADFLGQPTGVQTTLAVLHLAGLALAAVGLLLAIRRFFAEQLIVQVLAVAIVVNIAAYLFTVQAESLATTREIAAVLPFGAILAGKELAGRRAGRPEDRQLATPDGPSAPPNAGRARWQTASLVCLAVLAAGYAVMLGYGATRTEPDQGQVADLASWLAGHHLTRGLGGYWQSNSVTLDTSNKVLVRAIDVNGGKLTTGAYWEANAAWYDPDTEYADFIVNAPPPWHPHDAGVLVSQMESLVGKPARIYYIPGYTIAVWHQNLMPRLS
jgi:hypothetical protein